MSLILIKQPKGFLELGAVILAEVTAGKRLKESFREINGPVTVASQLSGCGDTIQLALGKGLHPFSSRVGVGPSQQVPVLNGVSPGILQCHHDRRLEDKGMAVQVKLEVDLTLQPERPTRGGRER